MKCLLRFTLVICIFLITLSLLSYPVIATPTETSTSKNSNLTQAKFINARKINPQEIKNVFAHGKKIMSNIKTNLTRGVGSSIYKSYAPAVAYILVLKDGKPLGAGSGVILSNQGDMITNFHVVNGGDSYKIFLKNYGKRSFFRAELEHCNQIKDLAHIKLTYAPIDIRTIELGNNKDVSVGDDVYAIGHPLELESGWVLSRGVVGQIFKDYKWIVDSKGSKRKATVIQTDTSVNPGNSGGPLITDQGKVVGINTFSEPDTEGLNFAVSVDEIKEFYQNRSSYSCDKVRVKPQPKPKIVVKKDTNGDGKIDKMIWDVTGNGKGNFMELDVDHDGKVDETHIDRNEDGYFETRVIEKPDWIEFWIDSNKDGQYDKKGFDYDKDWAPDKYEDIVG